MTREEFIRAVQDLPEDKRKKAYDALCEATFAINSVNCALHDTPLHGNNLFVRSDASTGFHATLWCQIYDLKRIFES